MNERIAKLTEQCYEYNETMQGTWFNKTKFAELLLQDCMSICEEQGDKGLDGHYCVDKIRREFGV